MRPAIVEAGEVCRDREIALWRDGMMNMLMDAHRAHLHACHRGLNYLSRRGLATVRSALATDVARVCGAQCRELETQLVLIDRAPRAALVDFYRRRGDER